MATQNAALELRENIKKIGAQMLGHAASEVDFDGKEVYIINPDGADNGEVCVSLSDIATKSQVNNTIPHSDIFITCFTSSIHGRNGRDRA